MIYFVSGPGDLTVEEYWAEYNRGVRNYSHYGGGFKSIPS